MKNAVVLFFSPVKPAAGVELPGARASKNRPVNGSAASGLSRPKGPARRQGANIMKRPVDSRHLHHSLSQKVINYERPCLSKLYLPGVVFICCAEDSLDWLCMLYF